MFVEVFLLDNLLMDLLVLRLAAALLSARPPLWRQLAAALISAAAAALAAYLLPAGVRLPLRLPLLALMASAFEFKSVRGFLAAAGAVLAATLTVGGLGAAIAFAAGESIGGVPGAVTLRVALVSGVGASMLPGAIRRLVRRRVQNSCRARVTVLHRGLLRRFEGFIDTGNTLTEPLSGLPVAVVRCRALERYANLPIPAVTAAGRGVLMGFRPERICVNGAEVDCLIALTRQSLSAEAIVPAGLVPPWSELSIRSDNGKNTQTDI